jgi:SNF2 family DNA or RNA helicase
MSKSIKLKNGIPTLHGFDQEELPDWITSDYSSGEPYFVLNKKSIEKLKRDILSQYKVELSPDFERQLIWWDNQPEEPPLYDGPIVQPEGIKLKDHQVKAVRYMVSNHRFGLFLGVGTGKTLIAISFLLTIMKDLSPLDKILIITPKKVLPQYKANCELYLPPGILANITYTNLESLHNHDNIYQIILFDESHKAKSYSSLANKNVRLLATHANYVFLFTGTPQDKRRHEIMAQLAILNQNIIPGKTKFFYRYFHINEYYQPTTERTEVQDELTSIIKSYSWGGKTEELITVTKENNFIISVKTPEAWKQMYKTFCIHRVIIIGDKKVVVAEKSALRMALRQICCGHIKDETKPDGFIQIENPKLKPLYKLLSQLVSLKANAIIYTEFVADIAQVRFILNKLNTHTPIKYAIGKGTEKEVEQSIDSFKTNQVQFLILQTSSGGVGLDFINTNHTIFYALPEGYINFTQAKGRTTRMNQEKERNYYYFICEETIEEDIYRALKNKKSFSDKLFRIYKINKKEK